MSMLLRRAMMMASSLVKHIISAVTGLVTFTTNVAADMPSVLCEFAPVQPGSGDPAPDNVRPISGWTGLTVTRAGKNCLDPSTVTAGYMNASGVIQPQNATRLEYTSDFIEIPPGVTYVTAGCDGLLSGEQGWVGYCLYDASGTFIQRFATTFSGWSYVLKISDHPQAKYLKVSARTWGHGVQGLCCIFEQNAAYAPYEGKTSVTVSWQSDAGTVYGGTLDMATGVLTVDRVAAVFDGSEDETWSHFSIASGELFRTSITERKTGVISTLTNQCKCVCSAYKEATNQGPGRVNGTFSGDVKNVDFVNDSYTATDAWRTYLGSNNVTFVYQLATPVTYQLTPAQIQSIIGTNNVWHNANGGITVEYYDNQ